MFWNSLPAVPWASPRGDDGGVYGNRRTQWGSGAEHVGAGKGRPEPYSLAHLRALFQRLIDAQEGRGDATDTVIVETLRGESDG